MRNSRNLNCTECPTGKGGGGDFETETKRYIFTLRFTHSRTNADVFNGNVTNYCFTVASTEVGSLRQL